MSTDNPYKSPMHGTVGSESAPAEPHGVCVLAEAKRGARFGAKATIAILTALFAIYFLVGIGTGKTPWQEYSTIDVLKTLGGAVMAMASIALVRKLWRRLRSGKQPAA